MHRSDPSNKLVFVVKMVGSDIDAIACEKRTTAGKMEIFVALSFLW